MNEIERKKAVQELETLMKYGDCGIQALTQRALMLLRITDEETPLIKRFDDDTGVACCPVCGIPIIYTGQPHCVNCGKAIYWGA